MNDDDLRALIRAADPAADLPSADPSGVARLLEETMSNDDQLEERRTGTRGRSPLTWLVAAAAVVLIGVGGSVALIAAGGDGDGPGTVPSAQETTSAPDDSEPTRTRLAGPAPVAGRCPLPTPELLAQQSLAFEGTVVSVTEEAVTLEPSRFYAGEETDLVEVEAPAGGMTDLVAAVSFEEGRSYLISATAGAVTACGFSGETRPDLEALYAAAFPG